MSTAQSEAFSRVLIDKALEFSGWNLLDPKQVQFEYTNVEGRADYILKDNLGRVLCVLEAKREDLDPYDAKEQARGYAENLSSPFTILSNGREHWFWNLERAHERDAYRIERLPSREDMELNPLPCQLAAGLRPIVHKVLCIGTHRRNAVDSLGCATTTPEQ